MSSGQLQYTEIGGSFVASDGKRYRVKEASGWNCKGCFFSKGMRCMDNVTGQYCCGTARRDRKEVIFVEE